MGASPVFRGLARAKLFFHVLSRPAGSCGRWGAGQQWEQGSDSQPATLTASVPPCQRPQARRTSDCKSTAIMTAKSAHRRPQLYHTGGRTSLTWLRTALATTPTAANARQQRRLPLHANRNPPRRRPQMHHPMRPKSMIPTSIRHGTSRRQVRFRIVPSSLSRKKARARVAKSHVAMRRSAVQAVLAHGARVACRLAHKWPWLARTLRQGASPW